MCLLRNQLQINHSQFSVSGLLHIHKLINCLKVVTGYLLSRISGKVIFLGDPISFSVEPTNFCNLKCPECPSGLNILTREKGFLQPEQFEQQIVHFRNTLFLTLYFQGEPYLHSEFSRLVAIAKQNSLYVTTSTNGHFMTVETAKTTIESGLDKLIISLDGTDESAYSSYRISGSFGKVIEGIRNITGEKNKSGSRKPRIVIQFLVLKTNEHQIETIKKTGKEMGADKVEIKSAQFYNFEAGHPLLPVNRKYSRYERKTDAEGKSYYRIKNRLPRHCFRMWSSCVITWDGWVVPCCYDKDARYRMGNIFEEPFEKIWRGKKYQDFRSKILSNRENIDICQNCAEGMGLSSIL